MKRFFQRYQSNKNARTAGHALTIAGVLNLIMFVVAKEWHDELGSDLSFWEVLLIIPMLIHIMLYLLFELLMVVGLIIGIPGTVSGIVLLILTAPYVNRLNEVAYVRKVNRGRLPGEFLIEMYENGELNDFDYRKELSNNLRLFRIAKMSGGGGIVPLNCPPPPPSERSAAANFFIGLGKAIGGVVAVISALLLAAYVFIIGVWLLTLLN